MARFVFVFLALLFVSATILVGLIFDDVVYDASQDQHHGLAPGGEEIMANLGLSVQAELFSSADQAGDAMALSARTQQLKNQLTRLQQMSGGRFSWVHREVTAHSLGEDELISLGLDPVILPDGRRYYLGMVLSNSIDQHHVFPRLAEPTNPNRRDLMMAIERLGHIEPVIMQVLLGEAAKPWFPLLREALGKQVEFVMLEEDLGGLRPDLPLLMMQPGDISGAGMALLSSALTQNMPLMVVVDPSLPGEAILPPPLLAQGLAMEDGVVVDESLAMVVRGQLANQAMSYPLWLELGQDNVIDEPLMYMSASLRLTGAGSLVIGRGANKQEVEPLVWSSDEAGILPRSFVSALPGELPRTGWKNLGRKMMALRVKREDLNALIFADLDFLNPSLGPNENAPMLARMLLDHAGLSQAVSLDPGLPKDRPFVRLEQMRVDARGKESESFARINQRISNLLATLVALQNRPSGSVGDDAVARVQEQLRDAERDLLSLSRQTEQPIDRTKQFLVLANSFLVPLILGLLGLVMGVARMRRRRQA